MGDGRIEWASGVKSYSKRRWAELISDIPGKNQGNWQRRDGKVMRALGQAERAQISALLSGGGARTEAGKSWGNQSYSIQTVVCYIFRIMDLVRWDSGCNGRRIYNCNKI